MHQVSPGPRSSSFSSCSPSVLFFFGHYLPLAALACFIAGCSGGTEPLRAGGSTLIGPLMKKWATDYGKLKGVDVDYARKGSGNGIQQMTEGNYDFGCTDAPMNKEELDRASKKHGEVLHLPLVFGGVAIVYNLPELADSKDPLRLSGPVLAEIYLGKIVKWNDPAIEGLNPGVKLPDRGIVVVRRAEPSGTTFIFTDYLASVSKEWKQEMGPGTKDPGTRWRTGSGQQGSQGVADHVKSTEGAIGYAEVSYALSNTLRYAAMQNSSGRFTLPEAAAITAAGREASATVPDDLCLTLNNQPGEASYPICGAVWAVLYVNQFKAGKAKGIVDYLTWCLHEGQQSAGELHYAPLPDNLVQKVEAKLKLVKGGSER